MGIGIQVKLGKLPKKEDPRNLKLAKYLPVPDSPSMAHWYGFKPISEWGMKGNDIFGNCVIVTASHIIDCARANESKILTRIPDDRVVDLSRRMGALDGYYILTRLKYWRKYGMWKSRINGFVDIEPIDHEYLKAAIWIFGHADIGLLMPKAWENSVVWDTGKTRDYIKGSWGGHSVPLLGYYISKKRGLVYYAATWGRIVEITASAIRTYCDEAYVSIVQDWFAKDNYTPNGFDAEQLEKDLKALD